MTPPVKGLSVVVPHFGDPEHALHLVQSLSAQTSAARLQIIVVDDCSPEPFPDTEGVTVVRRETNGGFGSAVNTGSASATQDYLLVLNSDLVIGKTFVEDLLVVARAHPSAVLSPAIFDERETYQWVGRRFPRTRFYVMDWLTVLAAFRSTRWWHRVVGHDVRCEPGVIQETEWVMGAAMLIPAKPFRLVGGFDESFFMNCEEIDLQRRLRAEGIRSIVAGTVSATHAGGGSSDPAKRRTWLVQARFLYARKWGENPRFLTAALSLASVANYLVNLVRQGLGRDIDARLTLTRELGYLKASS